MTQRNANRCESLLGLMIGLLLTLPCHGSDWSASVCRVRVQDHDGATSLGSGCLVDWEGSQYVLTNAHVVESSRSNESISLAWPSSGVQRGAVKLWSRKRGNYDLAILAVEGGSVPLPAVAIADDSSRHTSGTIYGFGGGQFAAAPVRVIGFAGVPGGHYYELSSPVRQGDSGGPVINDAGQLYAVVWGSDDRTSLANRVGPIRKALSWVAGRVKQVVIPSQYRCTPGVGCGPPVRMQPGVVVGMRPIQQAPAPPRELTPVPRRPAQPSDDCEKRLDTIAERLDSLQRAVAKDNEQQSKMLDLIESNQDRVANIERSGGADLTAINARLDRLQAMAAKPIRVEYDGSGRVDEVAPGGTLRLPQTEYIYVDRDNRPIDSVEVPIGGRLALGFGPSVTDAGP